MTYHTIENNWPTGNASSPDYQAENIAQDISIQYFLPNKNIPTNLRDKLYWEDHDYFRSESLPWATMRIILLNKHQRIITSTDLRAQLPNASAAQDPTAVETPYDKNDFRYYYIHANTQYQIGINGCYNIRILATVANQLKNDSIELFYIAYSICPAIIASSANRH